MTQADLNSSDGWIEWPGGKCPVDLNCEVEIKLRSGERNGTQPAKFWDVHPSWWEYRSPNDANDIVAYRIVEAA